VHPQHPISGAFADPQAHDHILQTFTSATHIIKSDAMLNGASSTREGEAGRGRMRAGHAVFLRLDRIEEKSYEKHDAVRLLQLPQVPSVVIFEGIFSIFCVAFVCVLNDALCLFLSTLLTYENTFYCCRQHSL
jgi:hypothetical protein